MDKLVKQIKENKMTLIVALPENSVELAKSAEEGGAKALKTHLNMTHAASGITFGDLDEEKNALKSILDAVDIPVGIVPAAEKPLLPVTVEELAKMGFDYFDMFAHFMEPFVLNSKNISKMVAVNSQYSMEDVVEISKEFDMMEIAVVSKEGYGKRLNVYDLIKYKKLAKNIDIPLIVPSQRKLIPEDVPYLYEIGIRSIMIGVLSVGLTPKEIYDQTYAFTKEIEKL